jgi:hypothetical protein
VSADNHKTQRGRLLKLLLDPRGDWVSLSDILALNIAQYSARIHELRRLGFTIENKTETVDGKRHSWFRLIRNEPQQALPLTGKENARYPD